MINIKGPHLTQWRSLGFKALAEQRRAAWGPEASHTALRGAMDPAAGLQVMDTTGWGVLSFWGYLLKLEAFWDWRESPRLPGTGLESSRD